MRIRVTIATVGLNQMPTAMQPQACQSSRGQVHGRRHGTGRVAQSERRHVAANNGGPCAKCDNVDSDNSGNNKTRKYLKELKNIKKLINLINFFITIFLIICSP